MIKSFRNYVLTVFSILLLICFVVSLVFIFRDDYTMNVEIAIISVAILSFFTSLYLLTLIRGKKNREQQ